MSRSPSPEPGRGRWHYGRKLVPGGKKKPFWMNRWLTHPCRDLALAFEIGTRAAARFERRPRRPAKGDAVIGARTSPV
jgi:hypothetical protein